MHHDEKRILEEICKKYRLEFKYVSELIEIEKKYARRNMSRRKGIFSEIEVVIQEWSSNQ